MPELKIGIQLSSLRLPFRQALPVAARLGVAAVEIDARNELSPTELTGTGLRQVRKMLEDHNLRVCAIAYPTRRGYNVADELDRRLSGTKAAMKMAHDLGCGFVINHVGRVPEQEDSSDWRMLIEALTDLARHGHHIGALLAADTGGESGADLARLLDALPPQSTVVNFNPGQLIVNSFSPGEVLTALGSRIVHVHAQDGVRDLARGRGIEVELGRGSADFPSLLGQLEEHNFRGYFTVTAPHSDDPAYQLGRAVKFLKNL